MMEEQSLFYQDAGRFPFRLVPGIGEHPLMLSPLVSPGKQNDKEHSNIERSLVYIQQVFLESERQHHE